MSTDPTAEHIDAVARAIDEGHHPYGVATVECHDSVRRLLTSTDATVHAALAASLPAEVMLAALVDRLRDAMRGHEPAAGMCLTVECACGWYPSETNGDYRDHLLRALAIEVSQ